MKKFLLLLAFPTLLSVTSQAQDSESRKPEAGDVTTEVNLGIFNSGVTLSNVFNQLRGRYFISPSTAFRLGFNATSNVDKTDATDNNNFSFKTNTSSFSISPGIEKHFAGTERLSPYVGAVLSFTSFNLNQVAERETGTPKKIEYINSRSNNNGGISQRGNTSYGLNAVAGVDYYFAKHFYAGLEFGYGLSTTKLKDAERKTDGKSDFKVEDKNTTTSIGAYANNGIRIGFVF